MRNKFRVLVALSVMLVTGVAVFPASAGTLADQISAVNPAAGDAVAGVESLLTSATTISQELPVDPQQALIDRTAELSAALGIPQDPTVQISLANLPDEIAGRLANVVGDLLACQQISATHLQEIGDRIDEVAQDGGGLDPAGFADIRVCAQDLWLSSSELELAVENTVLTPNPDPATCTPNGPMNIDVWPVLRFEGTCTNTTYLNDYLLTVELAGHDTYINNVGSNMVDVNFSPSTSLAVGLRGTGPARGCQLAIGAPGQGGLANGDCIPAAAVVLDFAGEDTFGVKQSPDIDAQCTSQSLVRRMVTVGVGFLGVGILRDAGATNDHYTGKTVSVGSGHVFGVGILSDAGGNDTYHAIRNSEGFALVGGAGLLRDEGGSDRYDFAVPAGGVIDDEGVCDVEPRFVQGAANVLGPTIGILIDNAGRDTYVGAHTVDFTAPADAATTGRGGSQGFGNNGAFGILFDAAGIDSYSIIGDQGSPARGNGVIIGPDPQCQNSACSGGVFIDR
ncbi:MAG: hypothetical protein ACRDI3_04870 [Actinomycetota bacterium]